jgi:hypothetical protein
MPDVFVVQIHIDEPIELAGTLKETRLNPGRLGLEIVEHIGHARAFGLDDIKTLREIPQR